MKKLLFFMALMLTVSSSCFSQETFKKIRSYESLTLVSSRNDTTEFMSALFNIDTTNDYTAAGTINISIVKMMADTVIAQGPFNFSLASSEQLIAGISEHNYFKFTPRNYTNHEISLFITTSSKHLIISLDPADINGYESQLDYIFGHYFSPSTREFFFLLKKLIKEK